MKGTITLHSCQAANLNGKAGSPSHYQGKNKLRKEKKWALINTCRGKHQVNGDEQSTFQQST